MTDHGSGRFGRGRRQARRRHTDRGEPGHPRRRRHRRPQRRGLARHDVHVRGQQPRHHGGHHAVDRCVEHEGVARRTPSKPGTRERRASESTSANGSGRSPRGRRADRRQQECERRVEVEVRAEPLASSDERERHRVERRRRTRGCPRPGWSPGPARAGHGQSAAEADGQRRDGLRHFERHERHVPSTAFARQTTRGRGRPAAIARRRRAARLPGAAALMALVVRPIMATSATSATTQRIQNQSRWYPNHSVATPRAISTTLNGTNAEAGAARNTAAPTGPASPRPPGCASSRCHAPAARARRTPPGRCAPVHGRQQREPRRRFDDQRHGQPPRPRRRGRRRSGVAGRLPRAPPPARPPRTAARVARRRPPAAGRVGQRAQQVRTAEHHERPSDERQDRDRIDVTASGRAGRVRAGVRPSRDRASDLGPGGLDVTQATLECRDR